MIRGIIFDFDGVIVDSEPVYINSLVEYLKRVGISTEFDEIKYVVGQHLTDIAKALINQFCLDITINDFIHESTDVYNEFCDIDKLFLMPGVLDFLKKCKRQRLKLCIASSSNYDYLTRIINNNDISEYFEFVLSGIDFEHSKPDPEIYNAAVKKLYLKKEEIIIIEDSYYGILAGLASGIYTIGLKLSTINHNTTMADKEVYSFEEIEI